MFGHYTLLRRQSLRVLALLVTLSGMIASAAPPAWWSNGNPPIITGAPERLVEAAVTEGALEFIAV